MHKPLMNMSILELKHAPIFSSGVKINTEITEADIYDIAASILLSEAHKIINKTLKCENIIEISILSKEIIAKGYPIDNILTQLNKAVLVTDKLDDYEKSRIINYSGKIFLKMKECSNEYIQLLDYMSSINGIKKGNTAYELNFLKS